jgi:hypothetical protein
MPGYIHSTPFDVLALQDVVHPGTVIGTAQTAEGKIGVHLSVFHGFDETAPNTNPGRFLIQVTTEGSGNTGWVTIDELRTVSGTPDVIDPTNFETAGATLIETTSTTGFVAGDVCFFTNPGAGTDGEWCQIKEVDPNVSVTLVDPTTNNHNESQFLRNDAQRWSYYLDLAGITRYRVVFLHEGATGADVTVWVRGVEVLGVEA